MKKYFILYKDGTEEPEPIEADSVRVTSSLISFFKNEMLVAAIAASEIKRVGEIQMSLFEIPKPPRSGREEIEKWWREVAAERPRPSITN